MAEQASTISREAKGLQQGLKEDLKTKDPWDKEVEFQRKNLRRQYLRLLLVHPYVKESKDAETHLWMQTSYAFIAIYKQRIANLDRALQSAPRHQPRQGGHGPVEYRKLMQRFRQFLAEEEKFWTQLVVRLRRSFGLDEAQSAIIALGLLPPGDAAGAHSSEPADQSHHRDGPTTNGRNQFQFPSEDTTPAALPRSSAERDSRLAILSKALVCLGDIARYRELYNESGGRPKAGHEESTIPARKVLRNKRGGAAGMDPIPRARNYDKAQQCYEQARLLVPYEGNPSHQLAILASYQKDLFGSLIHYYRALCVLQPYDTASENLGTVLNKALDQWKSRMKREREKNGGKAAERDPSSLAPRLRVETFKEKVIVLHALWRLGVDRMESTSPNHAENVLEEFFSLVSERVLPIDTISKVIVLAQGALWKHRTIRDSMSPGTTSSPMLVESHIATHILGLHRALLKSGLIELSESPPQDAAENDLAQRITATFRRMLPALRIAGKWLRANFRYVLQGSDVAKTKDEAAFDQKDKRKGGAALAIAYVPLFWDTYAQFTSALYRSFPAERLPVLISSLEEDVDMRGFLPLRKLMAGEEADGEGRIVASAQVHPNEEQLMRIADLLNDAEVLMKFENSPLVLSKNGSLVKPPCVVYISGGDQSDIAHPDIVSNQLEVSDRDDDAMTETSRDDPVGDAFRQVLDGSDMDDDEEDEIVWNPRASPIHPAIPPLLSSPPRIGPMSPIAPAFTPRSPALMSPTRPSAISPMRPKPVSPLAVSPAVQKVSTSTTAEDLLNSVMGGDMLQLPSQVPQKSSAPQPQLLFGSGPPNRPGHSIWSMSLDDSSFKFPSVNTGTQPARAFESHAQAFVRSPQSLSQTSWPSSYATSQGSQNHLPGAPPSGIGPYPNSIPNAGEHRRAPSAHFFTGQSPRNDIFGYSSASPQQPYLNATPLHGRGTYVDPAIMSTSGSLYSETSLSAYHNPSLHHHDTRLGQAFLPAAVPQIWGNNG